MARLAFHTPQGFFVQGDCLVELSFFECLIRLVEVGIVKTCLARFHLLHLKLELLGRRFLVETGIHLVGHVPRPVLFRLFRLGREKMLTGFLYLVPCFLVFRKGERSLVAPNCRFYGPYLTLALASKSHQCITAVRPPFCLALRRGHGYVEADDYCDNGDENQRRENGKHLTPLFIRHVLFPLVFAGTRHFSLLCFLVIGSWIFAGPNNPPPDGQLQHSHIDIFLLCPTEVKHSAA